MKYQYIPIEEIEKSSNLLTPGLADFEIVGANDEISKTSKSEMIKLIVKVWDCDSKQTNIFDYLLPTPKMRWKLIEFYKSIDKLEWYSESGEQATDSLIGQGGKCIIVLEKNDQYGDRMKIKSYLPPKASDAVKNYVPSTAGAGFEDDDLPF